MAAKDHSRLLGKIAHGVRRPGDVPPYARRWLRDFRLKRRAKDHVAFYRDVMRSDTARGAELAVGSDSHEHWRYAGQIQFDYLVAHGLRPEMRMLEIGCGNLRAGHLFVDYLDTGNYYGIDISPDILLAALETVADFGLQGKLPRLALVGDLKLSYLPERAFDVVHAHSVFSHSPIEVIDECLAHVGRVMAPGGFFDFTFNRTELPEHDRLREDFFYRAETLVDLAARHGLQAWYLEDWERGPHPHSKLRLVAAT